MITFEFFKFSWIEHGKSYDAKVSQNLTEYRFEDKYVDQNNYVRIFKHDEQCCKKFWHSINRWVLSNYIDDPTKIFSDLYLAKFLDTLS